MALTPSSDAANTIPSQTAAEIMMVLIFTGNRRLQATLPSLSFRAYKTPLPLTAKTNPPETVGLDAIVPRFDDDHTMVPFPESRAKIL